MLENITFKCYNCNKMSRLRIEADKRVETRRILGEGKRKITFLCEHCGAANEIEISLENSKKLLDGLSSTDPDVQRAINNAKKGDISGALDIARKRFGF